MTTKVLLFQVEFLFVSSTQKLSKVLMYPPPPIQTARVSCVFIALAHNKPSEEILIRKSIIHISGAK